MSKKTVVRSIVCSFDLLNWGKRKKLKIIHDEYIKCMRAFVDIFWEMEKLPLFIYKENYSLVESEILNVGIKRNAAEQALGIVKGVRSKQDKRKYAANKLEKENDLEGAKKLNEIIASKKISKPVISNNTPMYLTGTWAKVTKKDSKKIAGFLTISNGAVKNGKKSKEEISIPIKKFNYFNKYWFDESFTLASTIVIKRDGFVFSFKKPLEIKESGSVVGLDVGKMSVYSCSDGQQQIDRLHGYDYTAICAKLARKEKGSKAFKRTQEQRRNFVNWAINQIDWENIQTLRVENIKNLKYGRRINRHMQAWCPTEIFDKLTMKCEDENVSIVKVSPSYTSQRCSECGWTQRKNRNGIKFNCLNCGHTADADLNAAKNLSILSLKPLGKKVSGKNSDSGFFWN